MTSLTRSTTWKRRDSASPPRIRGRSSSFTALMRLKQQDQQHQQQQQQQQQQDRSLPRRNDSHHTLPTYDMAPKRQPSSTFLMPHDPIPTTGSSMYSGSDDDDDDDDDVDDDDDDLRAMPTRLNASTSASYNASSAQSRPLRVDPGYTPSPTGASSSTSSSTYEPPPVPAKEPGPISAPLEKKLSLQFKDKLQFARRSQSTKGGLTHGFSLWKHHHHHSATSTSNDTPKLYDDGKNVYPPRHIADTRRRDQYGFTQSTQWITAEEYETFEQEYTPIMARRSQKWRALLEENQGQWPQPSSKFKRYVRKGIPPEFRASAWFHYSGAETCMRANLGVYQQCVQKAIDMGSDKNEYLDIIERDLHRTFPDNVKFKSKNRSSTTLAQPQEGDSAAIRSLRNILYAFSVYAPSIGYCQSLNYIAGFLLLFMEEERAFWTFVTLIQDILPANVYDMSMEGASIDQNILMMLLSERCPHIWQRIAGGRSFWECDDPNGLGMPTSSLVTSHWFLTLFINILPTESVLRVWDCLFCEGRQTLMRVALAIFKMNEAAIMSVSDPLEVFQVVQNMPKRMVDCHYLMDATFYKYASVTRVNDQDLERRRAIFKQRRDERRRGKPPLPSKLQRGGVAGTLLSKAKERIVERAKSTVRHPKSPGYPPS
ncbi:rab-GTPase-TBC domain-containing protein [Gongronella butleri]|nr:rab-GTPase-TBC domain-containing protein [Gongronella butleri]